MVLQKIFWKQENFLDWETFTGSWSLLTLPELVSEFLHFSFWSLLYQNCFVLFDSLVKMICAVAVKNRQSPTPQEIIIAIKRNFGGLEGLDPVQEFGEFLPFILQERVLYWTVYMYIIFI